MKTKQVILLAIFALLYSQGFAQSPTETKPTESIQFKIASPSPYYVLKSGGTSIGIDTSEDDKFDLKSLSPEGIKEIHVLKDEAAISKYGDKGLNGVIIIVFKESYILPESLQTRFDDAK